MTPVARSSLSLNVTRSASENLPQKKLRVDLGEKNPPLRLKAGIDGDRVVVGFS
jgi:hypothetical protein